MYTLILCQNRKNFTGGLSVNLTNCNPSNQHNLELLNLLSADINKLMLMSIGDKFNYLKSITGQIYLEKYHSTKSFFLILVI